jgi:hypothetical protein
MLVEIATTNDKHRAAEIVFLNVSSPRSGGFELYYRITCEVQLANLTVALWTSYRLSSPSGIINSRQILIAADHSWCVCSDYDLTFTIVAGSKELVSRVLNDVTLEAIQVTPQTRIDVMPRCQNDQTDGLTPD